MRPIRYRTNIVHVKSKASLILPDFTISVFMLFSLVRPHSRFFAFSFLFNDIPKARWNDKKYILKERVGPKRDNKMNRRTREMYRLLSN